MKKISLGDLGADDVALLAHSRLVKLTKRARAEGDEAVELAEIEMLRRGADRDLKPSFTPEDVYVPAAWRQRGFLERAGAHRAVPPVVKKAPLPKLWHSHSEAQEFLDEQIEMMETRLKHMVGWKRKAVSRGHVGAGHIRFSARRVVSELTLRDVPMKSLLAALEDCKRIIDTYGLLLMMGSDGLSRFDDYMLGIRQTYEAVEEELHYRRTHTDGVFTQEPFKSALDTHKSRFKMLKVRAAPGTRDPNKEQFGSRYKKLQGVYLTDEEKSVLDDIAQGMFYLKDKPYVVFELIDKGMIVRIKNANGETLDLKLTKAGKRMFEIMWQH